MGDISNEVGGYFGDDHFGQSPPSGVERPEPRFTARPAVTMSDASLRRLREVAIQVLGEHRLLTPLRAVRSRCSCGWRWRPETDYVTHLAEALIGEDDIGTEFIDAVVAACQAIPTGLNQGSN